MKISAVKFSLNVCREQKVQATLNLVGGITYFIQLFERGDNGPDEVEYHEGSNLMIAHTTFGTYFIDMDKIVSITI